METIPHSLDPVWLVPSILGGFLVIFPLFWCLVCQLLSRLGGWHRLAIQYAAGDRPVTGETSHPAWGRVGGVTYNRTLTLHPGPEGFFMEVMVLFKPGHPRLFIPWTAISGSTPYQIFFWKAERFQIGQPVIGTITLPAGLLPPRLPTR